MVLTITVELTGLDELIDNREQKGELIWVPLFVLARLENLTAFSGVEDIEDKRGEESTHSFEGLSLPDRKLCLARG